MFKLSFFHIDLTYFSFLSSQDSLGASVQTSKNLYNNVANQHPSSILTLNHETIGIYSCNHLSIPFLMLHFLFLITETTA